MFIHVMQPVDPVGTLFSRVTKREAITLLELGAICVGFELCKEIGLKNVLKSAVDFMAEGANWVADLLPIKRMNKIEYVLVSDSNDYAIKNTIGVITKHALKNGKGNYICTEDSSLVGYGPIVTKANGLFIGEGLYLTVKQTSHIIKSDTNNKDFGKYFNDNNFKALVSKELQIVPQAFITKTYLYTINSYSSQKEILDIIKKWLSDSIDRLTKQYFHFILHSAVGNLSNENKQLASKNHGLIPRVETRESDIVHDYQSFDTIFTRHNKRFMRDIDRLNNNVYHERWGGKCKLSYLFHGPPGTGKTAAVAAMAKYSKRHIIEVPWSRLGSIEDLETIFRLEMISDLDSQFYFRREDSIILFDEIDKNFDFQTCAAQARDAQCNSSEGMPNVTNSDDGFAMADQLAAQFGASGTHLSFGGDGKISLTTIGAKKQLTALNLGDILTTLDGVGNYGGLIIVATANDISKIPAAFYRDLRMTAIKFDYLSRDEACEMVTRFLAIGVDTPGLEDLLQEVDGGHVTGATFRMILDVADGEHDDPQQKLAKALAMLRERGSTAN